MVNKLIFAWLLKLYNTPTKTYIEKHNGYVERKAPNKHYKAMVFFLTRNVSFFQSSM